MQYKIATYLFQLGCGTTRNINMSGYTRIQECSMPNVTNISTCDFLKKL